MKLSKELMEVLTKLWNSGKIYEFIDQQKLFSYLVKEEQNEKLRSAHSRA